MTSVKRSGHTQVTILQLRGKALLLVPFLAFVNSIEKIAAGEHKFINFVELSVKSVASLTSERSFGQDVSEMASGVNVFHLDQWIKVDSVRQPIKCHSVGAGYVFLPLMIIDHCFFLLKDLQQRGSEGPFCLPEAHNRYLPNVTPPTKDVFVSYTVSHTFHASSCSGLSHSSVTSFLVLMNVTLQ